MPVDPPPNPSIPVIILCGGQGMRMGDTAVKKELVLIGERPILWHVMKIYATYGHTHFILALGHQAEAIKRYFLEYEPMSCDFTMRLDRSGVITYHNSYAERDWTLTLTDTGPAHVEKGTRLLRAARYLDADTFCVTYGEAVGDVNLHALLAFHRQHGRLATVTGVHPQSQYGIFQVDETGQVSGFVEKPQLDHWINAGFMVFERGALDYLTHRENIHLEGEVLPLLARDGQLMMYRHTGYWRSMKTFKDALELDTVWRERAPWKVW